MTVREANNILRQHNEWRRSGEGEIVDPETYGKALDLIIETIDVHYPKDDQGLSRLGELNMLAALCKISDSQELERRRLQRKFSTHSPTGFNLKEK